MDGLADARRRASVCGSGLVPGFLAPLLAPCLQGTATLDSLDATPQARREDPTALALGLAGLRGKAAEAELAPGQRSELSTPSAGSASEGDATREEAASTSAGCSVDAEETSVEGSQEEQEAEGAPPSPSPSSGAESAAQRDSEGAASEPTLGRPSFAGTWDLVRTEGDLDRLLSDMGQSWLIRNGAKAFKYGVGRVVVECQQDGDDDLRFSKVLCDPRNLSKSQVHVLVGQGPVRFLDDIGHLVSTSQWEGQTLRFDAKLEKSGLAVTLLMYYDEAGHFVEEMISCKGTVAKYIFDRRA